MKEGNPVFRDARPDGGGVAAVLEELLQATSIRLSHEAPAGDVLLMGECIDAAHPTLRGRILVRWSGSGGDPMERWLPTLYRLPVREGDRVLLARVGNLAEAVVLGVLDGFARRPEPALQEVATLQLAADECVTVRSRDGSELLQIRQEEGGPVVRLLQSDLDLELPGALRLKAEDIRLEARQGRIELSATDDVIVRGEIIRLN
jgi:hypothetical protein